MSDITVEVEGVARTLAAFKTFQGNVAKGMKLELKAAAGLVATEAKKIAEAKGLRDTGDLIKSIRPGFKSSYAYVGDKAMHMGGPYNYPARYEYGQGGARAFLRPALDAKRAEVMAATEAMIAKYAAEFNYGGFR